MHRAIVSPSRQDNCVPGQTQRSVTQASLAQCPKHPTPLYSACQLLALVVFLLLC